ncbi:hypothetical protein G6F56_013426 [Rhizopus delemar]|nr:hypothetical protein G6F56_013426 [Rhizopus delemar]
MEEFKKADPYFVQTTNCAGKKGLSTYQKMTAAMRQLAYGTTPDLTNEYLRIGESTSMLRMKRFCSAVVKAFGFSKMESEEAFQASLDHSTAPTLLGRAVLQPGAVLILAKKKDQPSSLKL